jgi:hypothetical protein
MSFSRIIDALMLPPEARVDQRVPKKLLLEQGAPTAADKRLIQDGIEEIIWVAALKPTNIGVPVFKDDVREYLEIAVLTVSFRVAAKPTRLIELIHRAIPYPVLLIIEQTNAISLSLAHKRLSLGEADEVVIEDIRRTSPFQPDTPSVHEAAFMANLALSSLPALRDSLDDHTRLQRDIVILRGQAEKEKQLNRRVELNLEIKRLEAELAATVKTL